MNLRTRGQPLVRGLLVAVAGGLAFAIAACGGGDDNDDGGPTPAPGSGPGAITLRAGGDIMGQANKLLVVSALPEAGGAAIAEACIQVTSAKFAIPDAVMTDVQAGQPPCSGKGAKASLPEGNYVLKFAVYAPPAQSPEAETTKTVKVAGDVTVEFDGTAVSK